MTAAFQANKRTHLNSSGLRDLRNSGRLPAIVFNKQAENDMIHLPTREFQRWLRQGSDEAIKLQLEDGHSITVRLEEVQREPVTRELIHVDFLRVD
jgi:large subunit ribosomal protein L25